MMTHHWNRSFGVKKHYGKHKCMIYAKHGRSKQPQIGDLFDISSYNVNTRDHDI